MRTGFGRGDLMGVGSDGLVKVREGAVAWREIDGEAILLDLVNSTYLGLNASATVLWPEIMRGTTRTALVTVLQEHFDVPDARASADVDGFVAMCAHRDLLEP